MAALLPGTIFMQMPESIVMKRDGAKTSLWQQTATDFLAGQTTLPQAVDVVIIGGGITGITTAMLLQQQGKRCLLAEAHNLCFGTTGGTTAHLNTFLDTSYNEIEDKFGEAVAQQVAAATTEALGLYRKNIQTYNIDCDFAEKDGYVYAQDEKQADTLNKMFEASQRAGAAVSWVTDIPVPMPFHKAMVYSGQAQLHPTRYVLALAKAFEAAGGMVLQQCAVKAVEKEGDELLVTLPSGSVRANYVVYATHTPPGINLLHFRCAPYRSYALALTLKNNAYPNALAYDLYDPYHYFRTQQVDGKTYLIAGGEDHKTAHEANTEACFTRLEAFVRKHFDVDEVAFKWSSQYFEPADGLAYIGHLPGNPDNVYVATGFGGNGMTYSHIAALTLSQLITTGTSPYKDLFAPGRVKPVAGFVNFVKENADVVAQFFAKRLQREAIESLAELAPGEAKVVTYEGDTLALYKDETGSLHALNPVCTHAKCVVGWNSAERSWDCPCHGARYSVDGEVLTGPARKGLERIELVSASDNKQETGGNH